jgi:hypothetical protein
LDLICEAKSLFTNKHHLNIDINGWKVCSIRCNWVVALAFVAAGEVGIFRGLLVVVLLCCYSGLFVVTCSLLNVYP